MCPLETLGEGNHRSPMDSSHKEQGIRHCDILLLFAWRNYWTNSWVLIWEAFTLLWHHCNGCNTTSSFICVTNGYKYCKRMYVLFKGRIKPHSSLIPRPLISNTIYILSFNFTKMKMPCIMKPFERYQAKSKHRDISHNLVGQFSDFTWSANVIPNHRQPRNWEGKKKKIAL